MNYARQIELAESFLLDKGLSFDRPGAVHELGNNVLEIRFLKPEAFDPKVAVVDPPDERVLVNCLTDEVSLVFQM